MKNYTFDRMGLLLGECIFLRIHRTVSICALHAGVLCAESILNRLEQRGAIDHISEATKHVICHSLLNILTWKMQLRDALY